MPSFKSFRQRSDKDKPGDGNAAMSAPVDPTLSPEHLELIRQLEQQGEPLSLSEEIADLVDRGELEEADARFEKIKQTEFHVAKLQRMSISDLMEVAKAENDVFRRHGMGQYTTSEYTRVRGHGMGLFADSKPHLLEDVTTRIEAGMALIVHPNTYHPVVGYMVLGDGVAVTRDGCEVLTGTARELFSVPA